MRIFTPVLFATMLGMALQAAPISKGDKEFTQSALHATRKLFLDSVAGLSQAQLNYKPAADRWSIAEVVEHIALSEEFIFKASQSALKTPARTPLADPHALDEKILAGVADRSHKANAPEPLRPAAHFKSTAEAIAAFKASRDAHIAYVGSTSDALREHFAAGPGLGDIDALQWILLMSAHTERHVGQILEIKASPEFPKQ